MRINHVFLGFILLISPISAWGAAALDNYNAGVTFYNQKQYDQAISSLKEAVQLDPQFWQAYQVLGTCFYQKGDKTSAMTAIQTSLKIHPDNPGLQKFANGLEPVPAAQDSSAASIKPHAAPVSSVGMSVRSVAGPGSKSQHIFLNLGLSFELPFTASLGKSENAFKSQFPSGTFDDYSPQIMYFNFELGYELDNENGLAVYVNPHTANSGPSLFLDKSNYSTGDFVSEGISGEVNNYGLRYYRYLPDSWGRWLGFVGADYYSLNLLYGVSQGSGVFPSDSGSSTDSDMTGSTFGGSLGVGREVFFFGFLSLEASVELRFADISRITGPYKSSTTTNNVVSPAGSGQGTLVSLSNGSVVLVDANNVGTAKIADLDLTGLEGRAVLNIWF